MRKDRISRLVNTSALIGIANQGNVPADFAQARKHRGRGYRLTAPVLGNREQT